MKYERMSIEEALRKNIQYKARIPVEVEKHGRLSLVDKLEGGELSLSEGGLSIVDDE